MTKITLVLWAMDFMYGVGYTLLTIGILTVIAFMIFAVAAGMCWYSFKEYGDSEDEKKYNTMFLCAKKSLIVFSVAFLIVAIIPSKATCYSFMAGEISKLPAVHELTQDARDILNDVKLLIHQEAIKEKK